jgi:DNA-binding PadR family transcriptional regulator
MPKRTLQDDLLPLSPIVLHMLLALADGEKHGYAIMKAVEDDTGGDVAIPLGSLYGAIKRMMAGGLIEESDERPDPDLDDERRRYYRITPTGEQTLSAEVQRLERTVAIARSKRAMGKAG